MTFDGKCPMCGSDDIEVCSNDDVEWGNNDQGYIQEYWLCHACSHHFDTVGIVEVVERNLKRDVMKIYRVEYEDDFENLIYIDGHFLREEDAKKHIQEINTYMATEDEDGDLPGCYETEDNDYISGDGYNPDKWRITVVKVKE